MDTAPVCSMVANAQWNKQIVLLKIEDFPFMDLEKFPFLLGLLSLSEHGLCVSSGRQRRRFHSERRTSKLTSNFSVHMQRCMMDADYRIQINSVNMM